MTKTLIMLGIVCLMVLILELDFFIALPKFGAQNFGAPDDLKELVKKIPDKSPVVVFLGIVVMIAVFVCIGADFVWAILDTYHNYQGMWSVFLRFIIILWGYKFFDIICIDLLLLTKIRFPEKLYPETKGAKGYDSFGFNKKSQSIKLVLFFGLAVLLAFIFKMICG